MIDTQFAAQKLKEALRKDLTVFSADLEEAARQESFDYWPSDSGSARASITAYVIGEEDHTKNFSDPTWLAAQSPGYTSPRHRNPAINFRPHVETVECDDMGMVLTVFVGYAEALEQGVSKGNAGFLENVVATKSHEFLTTVQYIIGRAL